MNELRNVNGYALNEGNLMAKGLYNISHVETNRVSLWFDEETKDEFLSLSDDGFVRNAEANLEN
jgi:hypothetical protein